MSYPSEYEDDRPTEGTGRPASAAPRPAWDAATYGRPDDRPYSYPRPSSRDRAATGDHRYGDGVSAEPLYSSDDYSGEPFSGDAYSTDGHRGPAYSYSPRPYPGSYVPDPYPADANPPDPYPPDPYPPGPYPPGPYPPGPYGAGPPPVSPYPPESSRLGPFPADIYPAARSRDEVTAHAAGRPSGKSAGRNLPAAIGIGVLLAAAVLASLFLWRPAFLGVVVVAVSIGCWELARAMRSTGVNPPLVPLVAGGALMAGLAWWGHGDALTFGLVVTVLAVMVWRLTDGPGGYGRDVTAATLIAVYVPFLGGFAALLASPADGDLRVLAMLAGVVLSDTGGYVAGVLFGKHAMAPLVSPKKSWEGLAGSMVAGAVGGALLLFFLFEVPLWLGALFGLAVSAAAVLGDLGESLVKRDLGVKDMSNLLPGHGGLMDRLDSIVFAAPTAYVLLVLMAPPL
jgi:phosphatidate cytidylyltransferase